MGEQQKPIDTNSHFLSVECPQRKLAFTFEPISAFFPILHTNLTDTLCNSKSGVKNGLQAVKELQPILISILEDQGPTRIRTWMAKRK